MKGGVAIMELYSILQDLLLSNLTKIKIIGWKDSFFLSFDEFKPLNLTTSKNWSTQNK